MKTDLDYPAIKTALRAAGATMIGNAFIAAMLLEAHNWVRILSLLVAGFCLIITVSFKGE
jgi:hypothetical protein